MQLTSSSPSGSEVARHYPVNILLVDDRPENLLALEAILEPLGENLVLAASGQDALSQSLRQEFALVLLDVSMPDMDGFETARRIKGRRKSAATPIIFLTANNPDDGLILRGYEAGAADYLLKPLTPDVVRSKVAVFADLYRSRENARTSAAEVARAQAAALEAQEGQKRLSDVLERISDAFFALDGEWRFTYVNEKAALLLHREREDLLGKVIWDEFPELIATAFYEQYHLAVAKQCAVSFADFFAPIETWFEVHAYPSREGLSVYFEDVSEKQRAQRLLQESEKRYRSLVEATAAAVWKLDPMGNITGEEQGWHQLTGQSIEQMRGEGWLDAIHPDDRESTVAQWAKALAERTICELEHRVRTATGEWRGMFVRAIPVFGGGGELREWVGTHTDITARKQAETERDLALHQAVEAREAAEHAQEDAETANRGKSEFLATMSHEFRTPLNAIFGYTQLLDMGVLGDVTHEQHDHLQRLRASGVHLLGLVNDILDLSKIEAGHVQVSRETGLVSEVVRGAKALVGPLAVARGIRYPEEFEGDPGTSYVGDPDRVRQILVNLLSNAVKFTSPGGRVALSCGLATHGDPGARLVGSGPWTYLRVTDTGIGIPAEQLVRIFEPFVQAKAGYTRSEGGTGLGLAISRRLARLMAGDITVRSEVGKGSTFTLWLRGATADARPTTVEYPALPPSVDAVDSTAVRELTTKVMREIEPIAERYVYRLRTETGVPDLSNVSQAYIKDHADTLIAEIVTATSFLAETKGRASDLLRDGAEIQRLLAELHGAQRCKLGWTEAEVQRDVDTLREELERSTRALGGDPAATDFMIGVARRILDQWKQTSVRGHRFERAARKR